MPRVLTDGKTKIGAFRLPDRKKIALAILKDNELLICGYFNSVEVANSFMDALGRLVNAEFED